MQVTGVLKTSLFNGVYLFRSGGYNLKKPWYARCARKGIGYFGSQDDATLAYSLVAHKQFGQDAKFNTAKQPRCGRTRELMKRGKSSINTIKEAPGSVLRAMEDGEGPLPDAVAAAWDDELSDRSFTRREAARRAGHGKREVG
jgi:hypothetical protein